MGDAEIMWNGAVLLGKNVVCDAHWDRPLRIITHAHSDHLLHLRKSIPDCAKVLATPLTREIIGVLKDKRTSESITALDYEHPFEYEREKLTLYPAHHIPGSCQVLVETEEGKRILYTGDFRFPPVGIIEADILVTEATYGNPRWVRRFSDKVSSELIKLVRDSLKKSSVYIFGYHGKLQEVVEILNRAGIDKPILVSEKVFHILELCRAHGMKVTNFYLSKSEEGLRLRNSHHIGVYHVGAYRWMGEDGVKIFLSGWQFDSPCKAIGYQRFKVALSDHSDFEGLMEYVSKVRPCMVVADGYRSRDAVTFAREIESRLGIQAIAMPE